MRWRKQKRRIASRSTRAVTTGTRDGGKEDDMVPGITDTECRIAEFRYGEQLAFAERQRIAAQASAPESDRLGRIAFVHDQLNALVRRMSQSLHGIRTLESAGAARIQALSVGK
jgi:hypothetical protein